MQIVCRLFIFLSHLAAKGNEVHLSRRLQYWTISSVKPELPFSFHPASYSPYNSTHPWNCQPQNSVSQAVEVALVSTGHVVTCSPRAPRQACLRGTTIMSSALGSCCRWASRTGRDVIASSLTFGGSLKYQACNEVHHEHNRGCCHQRQMMWNADDRQQAANYTRDLSIISCFLLKAVLINDCFLVYGFILFLSGMFCQWCINAST